MVEAFAAFVNSLPVRVAALVDQLSVEGHPYDEEDTPLALETLEKIMQRLPHLRVLRIFQVDLHVRKLERPVPKIMPRVEVLRLESISLHEAPLALLSLVPNIKELYWGVWDTTPWLDAKTKASLSSLTAQLAQSSFAHALERLVITDCGDCPCTAALVFEKIAAVRGLPKLTHLEIEPVPLSPTEDTAKIGHNISTLLAYFPDLRTFVFKATYRRRIGDLARKSPCLAT